MEYRKAKMLGRLANGFEADRGSIVHAVILKSAKRPPCPYNDFGRKEIPNDDYKTFIALCGTKPGRRSVGWSDVDENVSCPRCLKNKQLDVFDKMDFNDIKEK